MLPVQSQPFWPSLLHNSGSQGQKEAGKDLARKGKAPVTRVVTLGLRCGHFGHRSPVSPSTQGSMCPWWDCPSALEGDPRAGTFCLWLLCPANYIPVFTCFLGWCHGKRQRGLVKTPESFPANSILSWSFPAEKALLLLPADFQLQNSWQLKPEHLAGCCAQQSLAPS